MHFVACLWVSIYNRGAAGLPTTAGQPVGSSPKGDCWGGPVHVRENPISISLNNSVSVELPVTGDAKLC